MIDLQKTRGRTPRHGRLAVVLSRIAGALVVAAACSMAAPATHAEAQEWTNDREAMNGRGFEIGNYRLHPGFGAEVGYDSNVFYTAEGEESAGIMRLTGHLNFVPVAAEEGEERNIDLRGGVHASFLNYFGIDRYNLETGADVSLHIRPAAPVSFAIANSFSRTIRPFVEGTNSLRFARDMNTTTALLHFRSESGTLRAAVGYRLRWDFFEDDVFDYAGSLTHTILSRASWAFFPNTGLVYEGEVSRVSVNGGGPGTGSLVADGWRLRQEVGLNGALSRVVSLTAMGGYSANFFFEGSNGQLSDAQSGTFRLELRVHPGDVIGFKVGYQRLYNPSSIGAFARHDRLYLNADLRVTNKFRAGARFSATRSQTGLALDATGGLLGDAPRREAWRVQTDVFAEFLPLHWLGINVTLRHIADITDFQITNDPALVDQGAEFSKFQAWLGVRVAY